MTAKIRIERWGDDRIAADIPWEFRKAGEQIIGRRAVWDTSTHPKTFRFWSYPLSMHTCTRFREVFGDDLDIGPNLWEWAWDLRRVEESMEELRAGAEADLPRVRAEVPRLWTALTGRPFQIAGGAFIKNGRNVCLGDEPRLGKTFQALAAIVEAGLDTVLVACPRTACRTVWGDFIRELLEEEAYIAQGDRLDRELIIQRFKVAEGPRFLVVNHRMLNVVRAYRCPDGNENRVRPGKRNGCQEDHYHKTVYHPDYPGLFDYAFDAIILDESHDVLGSSKHQLSDQIPQVRLGAMRLQSAPDGIRLALSGTPFRSDNLKAWGTLNWLDPTSFSSFWRYAEEQFGVKQNGFQGARVIGKDLKDPAAFQDLLRPYYLARTKAEVAPQLLPIEYAGTHPRHHPNGPVGIYLYMVDEDGEPTAQARAYRAMEETGLSTLSDGRRLTANGVLAELTRLKQFAFSQGKMSGGKFRPSAPSCKLDWILEFLKERQALTGKVVIASQYTEVVEFLEQAIRAKKWEVVTITGKSTDKQREHTQRIFKDGSPRVCIINMFAGGQAIDLSAADELIMVDEPWVAHIIEQTENRIQNLAKKNQLTIYRLRAAGTIEEDIALMTSAQLKALLAGRPEALAELVELREARMKEAA